MRPKASKRPFLFSEVPSRLSLIPRVYKQVKGSGVLPASHCQRQGPLEPECGERPNGEEKMRALLLAICDSFPGTGCYRCKN
jgi:hypothetical protein